MARLLTKAVNDPATGETKIEIDVGKVLAGMVAGIAIIAISAFLYVQGDLAAPAGAAFEAGQAILFTVLGVAAGEKAVGKKD